MKKWVILTLCLFLNQSHATNNEYCLTCHKMKTIGYEGINGIISLYTNEAEYTKSEHGKLKCLDCHQSKQSEDVKGCLDEGCHKEEESERFQKSKKAHIGDVHMAENIDCNSCHTHKKAEQTCLDCHKEEKEIGTKHDWLVHQEAHLNSLNCIDCHEHNLFAEKKCNNCHSEDSDLVTNRYVIGKTRNKLLEIIYLSAILTTIGGVSLHGFVRVIIKKRSSYHE